MRSSPLTALILAALGAFGPTRVAAMQFPDDRAVESLLRNRIEEGRGIGIVVGLREADGRTRVVFAGSAGKGKRPLGSQTIFEIGSITKVFTGTLLAQMVDRGEVGLSDPVAKYLPYGVRVPAWGTREITLRDLAKHRSALPRLPTNMGGADPGDPYASYTAEKLYAFLSAFELTRPIDSVFEYSNLGVGLLGHALSRAAGGSYETVVRERILDPLRMNKTGVELKADVSEWMAQGHNARNRPVPAWSSGVLVGAGGLRADVLDMLRFLDANIGEPDSDLERSMRAAHRRSSAPANPQSAVPAIGLTWLIQPIGNKTVLWHNGGTGGFRSFIAFDPDREVGVVVLANSSHSVDDIGMHLLVPSIPLTPSKRKPTGAILVGLAVVVGIVVFAMWKTSRD